MNRDDSKALQREILLGFWKTHILHHASEGPVVGQWMLKELHRHGYDVSPGTIAIAKSLFCFPLTCMEYGALMGSPVSAIAIVQYYFDGDPWSTR